MGGGLRLAAPNCLLGGLSGRPPGRLAGGSLGVVWGLAGGLGLGRNDGCYGGAIIRNHGARCAMIWPGLGNGNCSAANECVYHSCLFQGARRCQIENTYLLYSKIPFNCLAIISVPNQNESPATPQKDPQTTPPGSHPGYPPKGSSQEKNGG